MKLSHPPVHQIELRRFSAVKLMACGHPVRVLARGRRAEQLRAEGLVVQEYERPCLRSRVDVIESLDPEAFYDKALVLVRNDQVASVMPSLAASKASPSLVFMVQQPDWIEATA